MENLKSASTIEGSSGAVLRPGVRHRRNHGAPHWLLSHQWGGDHILHGQDTLEDDSTEMKKKSSSVLMFYCNNGCSLIPLAI